MLVAYDKCLLLLVAIREAEVDGREGVRAVAHNIANRVKAWGKSWVAVMTDKNQFSSMTVLGDPRTIYWPPEPEVVNYYALVSNIYDGTDSDNTSGSLYYANETVTGPGWYRTHIIESPDHPVVATVGRHTFRK